MNIQSIAMPLDSYFLYKKKMKISFAKEILMEVLQTLDNGQDEI